MSFLRHAFFLLIVRPLVLVVLGLNVRHRERLPNRGPAIVVANHNSHLDTLVLMTLFPWSTLGRVRPVAAADYFLRNRLMAWLSMHILRIVPIERAGSRPKSEVLAPALLALDEESILILFPEGTRGEPETPRAFKSGVYHLARERPGVPIVPVYMHGLGKALPRGEAMLVPFFCDVFVGEPLPEEDDKRRFMATLGEAMGALAAEGRFPAWE